MSDVKNVINTHRNSIDYQLWRRRTKKTKAELFIDEFSLYYATDANWQLEPVLKKMASFEEDGGLMSASELRQELNTKSSLFKQISISCFGHPKNQLDNRALALNEIQYKRAPTPAARHLLTPASAFCQLLKDKSLTPDQTVKVKRFIIEL